MMGNKITCGIPAHEKYKTKWNETHKTYVHYSACTDADGDSFERGMPCAGSQVDRALIPKRSPAWMWYIHYPWRWVSMQKESIDPDELSHYGTAALWSFDTTIPRYLLPFLIPKKHANTPGHHGFPPLWFTSISQESHEATQLLIANGADADYAFPDDGMKLREVLAQKGREYYLDRPYKHFPDRMNRVMDAFEYRIAEGDEDVRIPPRMRECGFTLDFRDQQHIIHRVYRLARDEPPTPPLPPLEAKDIRHHVLSTLRHCRRGSGMQEGDVAVDRVHPSILGIVLSALITTQMLVPSSEVLQDQEGFFSVKTKHFFVDNVVEKVEKVFDEIEPQLPAQQGNGEFKIEWPYFNRDLTLEIVRTLGYPFIAFDSEYMYFGEG
jgi:hypothetical protein